MKKVLKLLMGFPIGIAVLVLTYVLIGAVEGQATYTEEIMKLTEFKYLLAQATIAGMSYIVVGYAITIFADVLKPTEERTYLTWKGLGKFIVEGLIIFLICLVISRIINRRGTLKGYVGEVFYGLTGVVLVVSAIVAAIYNTFEMRKINKQLKKRQEESK